MPVENHFFGGERPKEAPDSMKKGLTPNSLQRKTGTAETKNKKNPQLLSNWDCIICGYFPRP
jgi:hypothetical protein